MPDNQVNNNISIKGPFYRKGQAAPSSSQAPYPSLPGEGSAATSRELERTFSVRGKELRDAVNRLRRRGVPIASSSSGYFYAAAEQEVRATIAHMTHRIAASPPLSGA